MANTNPYTYSGAATTNVTYKITANAPLDNRVVVNSYESLQYIENPYVGMVVTVKGSANTYVLTTVSASGLATGATTKLSDWRQIYAEITGGLTSANLASLASAPVGSLVLDATGKFMELRAVPGSTASNWTQVSGNTVLVQNEVDLTSIPNAYPGTLAMVTSTGTLFVLRDTPSTTLSNWKGVKGDGIPVLSRTQLNKLASAGRPFPDEYISFSDETELYDDPENDTVHIHNDGSHLSVLYKAIRALQSRVTKIVNTFNSGIISYTDNVFAASNVLSDAAEELTEPVWAIDPQECVEVPEVSVTLEDMETQLTGTYSVPDTSDEAVKITGDTTWNLGTLLENYIVNLEETDEQGFYLQKHILYIRYQTTQGADRPTLKLFLQDRDTDIDNPADYVIDVMRAITDSDVVNLLVMLQREYSAEIGDVSGKNLLYVSATDNNRQNIGQGYFKYDRKRGVFDMCEYECSVGMPLNFTGVQFNNMLLKEAKYFTRATSYTSDSEIPQIPTEDDFAYRVAHITIRSVQTKDLLKKYAEQNRFLPNELIFVEENEKLYINTKLKGVVAVGASGSDDEDTNNTDNEITMAELIEALAENGIVNKGDSTNPRLTVNGIGEVTFINEDTKNAFTVNIDADGNFRTIPVVTSNNTIGLSTSTFRYLGYGAHYNMEVLKNKSYETNIPDAGMWSQTQITSMVKGDRVRIGAWYIMSSGQPVTSCSHEYIELENSGTDAFPLDDIKLITYKPNAETKIQEYNLKGVIPAGGTYLIRAAATGVNIDSYSTFIKVRSYDIELRTNGTTDALTGTTFLMLAHKSFEWKPTNWYTEESDTQVKVNPLVVDAVLCCGDTIYVGNDSNDSNKLIASSGAAYVKSAPQNSIVRNKFFLEPAKQGYRSLTTSKDASNIRTLKVASETIPLNERIIRFPNGDASIDVSVFTPRASFEGKNVFTDKTEFDTERPNCVVCSFGQNMLLTRCFNWVSGGYHDEYVFIKNSSGGWDKFESYKGVAADYVTASGYPVRKGFVKAICDATYKRLSGAFPGSNQEYTAHKCIVQLRNAAVSTPTTYTYCVGRALSNGAPDPLHCSGEYTFTLYPSSYTPYVVQTTDQQGFSWIEYAVWNAAAEFINKEIAEKLANNDNTYPVFVNTGDMTQNGTRVNEWLDYFIGGACLFSHLEHMAVVGNNDLSNAYTNEYMGTGDDDGKHSPHFYNIFCCYEVDNTEFTDKGDWNSNVVYNNKYVPSTYYFYHPSKMGFIFVNSELTDKICRVHFQNNVQESDTYNLYTGYKYGESAKTLKWSLKETIAQFISNINAQGITTGRTLFACHEMPFTVITHTYLSKSLKGVDRSITTNGNLSTGTPKSLVGSHLNRISYTNSWNNDDNYWFSRMLQENGAKLCIGGHKHTYACTWPVKDIDGENTDNHSSKSITVKCAKVTVSKADVFEVTYNNALEGGVVYFMLQATGFKQKSNKELPGKYMPFSCIVPQSTHNETKNTDSPHPSQLYPMYATIELGTNVFNISLYRIANIQTNVVSSSGDDSVTEFSYIDYATGNAIKEKLLRLTSKYEESPANQLKWYSPNWTREEGNDRVISPVSEQYENTTYTVTVNI